jgi:hypothetical protein
MTVKFNPVKVHRHFKANTIVSIRSLSAQVWFGLFIHLFSHICNTGHVNYRLQFTTHLVIYIHLHNTI